MFRGKMLEIPPRPGANPNVCPSCERLLEDESPILLAEIAERYNGAAGHDAAASITEGEQPFQYSDFVAWQNRLDDATKLDDKADRWIGYAVDGAARMKQLINDLLHFSRLGHQELAIQPTDLNAVVQLAPNSHRLPRNHGASVGRPPCSDEVARPRDGSAVYAALKERCDCANCHVARSLAANSPDALDAETAAFALTETRSTRT
jgi:hypothetical protein